MKKIFHLVYSGKLMTFCVNTILIKVKSGTNIVVTNYTEQLYECKRNVFEKLYWSTLLVLQIYSRQTLLIKYISPTHKVHFYVIK